MSDEEMMDNFDSDDDSFEGQNKLQQYNGSKKQNFDSDDEVMGGLIPEEDDHDSIESDIEGLNTDFNLPNEKAWGKKKKAYYATDYVDPDYNSVSQKDIEEAEKEEEVATSLQKRLFEQIDENDFGLESFITTSSTDGDDKHESYKTKTDLDKLGKREKKIFFEKESPEFKPLLADFKGYLKEAKHVLVPYLKSFESNYPELASTKFFKTKLDVIMHYCMNISYYLMLKSKNVPIASHPVIKKLGMYKEILYQIEKDQGDLIEKAQILLESQEEGKTLYKVKNCDKSVYEDERKLEMSNEEDSEEDNEEDNEEENDDVMDESSKNENNGLVNPSLEQSSENPEDEKRFINYQIAKNKGLTPHRKKEQRNPRVKHRNKYRKAIIHRKGAVRQVRKEVTKYGGEISGIKAGVKKGIKLL
ncbi:hypothetical protein TKK_0005035 [Trichogramma kaykai]|uniref:Sas10 C-terminal domain-containing protein n=1 Tax=Trichogramma kaykai TaxID=54128 RepID=A0ABD2XJ86_9HYME